MYRCVYRGEAYKREGGRERRRENRHNSARGVVGRNFNICLVIRISEECGGARERKRERESPLSLYIYAHGGSFEAPISSHRRRRRRAEEKEGRALRI